MGVEDTAREKESTGQEKKKKNQTKNGFFVKNPLPPNKTPAQPIQDKA